MDTDKTIRYKIDLTKAKTDAIGTANNLLKLDDTLEVTIRKIIL